MEKLYKITGKTNGWIAQRDTLFKGREFITIINNLSLPVAKDILLTFFNCDYSTSFPNWGLVRCHYPFYSWSHSDGTRGYEYDSRYYSIEEQKGVEAENYGIV